MIYLFFSIFIHLLIDFSACVTFYPPSSGINQATIVPATVTTQKNGFLESPNRKFEATNGKISQKIQQNVEKTYDSLCKFLFFLIYLYLSTILCQKN